MPVSQGGSARRRTAPIPWTACRAEPGTIAIAHLDDARHTRPELRQPGGGPGRRYRDGDGQAERSEGGHVDRRLSRSAARSVVS